MRQSASFSSENQVTPRTSGWASSQAHMSAVQAALSPPAASGAAVSSTCTGRVVIAGTPATAKATMRLGDMDAGSELTIDVQVTVKVPIVGARVEEAVAEQIRNLLTADTEFTLAQIA